MAPYPGFEKHSIFQQTINLLQHHSGRKTIFRLLSSKRSKRVSELINNPATQNSSSAHSQNKQTKNL